MPANPKTMVLAEVKRSQQRTARADTVLKLCGSLGIEPSALFEGLSWTRPNTTKVS